MVERILAASGRGLHDVLGNAAFLKTLEPARFTDDRFGLPTVRDILAELEKPGRDPRPEFKTAAFKEGVEKLTDLQPGMVLEGVVTNVANFGAFVDIGVHQDGLVHISALADRFVKDPREVVKAGQVVKVKVLEVDLKRQRIALTMRLNEPATGAPARKAEDAPATGTAGTGTASASAAGKTGESSQARWPKPSPGRGANGEESAMKALSQALPLRGQVALITGGGRGIGAATAEALARKGAQVIVASRTEAELAATVARIQADGLDAAVDHAGCRRRGGGGRRLCAHRRRTGPAGHSGQQRRPAAERSVRRNGDGGLGPAAGGESAGGGAVRAAGVPADARTGRQPSSTCHRWAACRAPRNSPVMRPTPSASSP